MLWYNLEGRADFVGIILVVLYSTLRGRREEYRLSMGSEDVIISHVLRHVWRILRYIPQLKRTSIIRIPSLVRLVYLVHYLIHQLHSRVLVDCSSV